MSKMISAFVCILIIAAPFTYAETVAVDSEEQARWLKHVIPLPHKVHITDKATIDPKEVSIITRPDAGPMELNAAALLQDLFKEKTGSIPDGDSFKIIIGVLNESGKLNGIEVPFPEQLISLPNSDQAYSIRPRGKDTLLLTAVHGKGIYYAANTLQQLITPFISAESVTIPIASILDWPDMEERGLWNFPDIPTWIPWLSSLKLNFGKMVATNLQRIERGKPNHAKIDKDFMLKARGMGFNYLPFILHLNFLHGIGMFSEYPKLAGVGDGALAGRYFAHKLGNQHRAPCAANPMLAKIISEWMMDIASQGADEVSCWLTERPAQCGHKECIEIGQFVLEARAFVDAWEVAKKTYPDFTIRLFISTTTNERYHKILAETPKEVKLERCCSTDLERVRRLPRDIYVNPLFDSYAADGHWVAQYDVPIGAYGRVETPEFKVPCSSAHRIRDYVSQLIDRKYSGAYGMLAWGNYGIETCGFNIHALAEWSWNRDGRTEAEFAEAWAIRQGYANPAKVAEWSEIMGPVEFDIYESDFPTSYSWGKAIAMVDERRSPILGQGMFRYYLDSDDFDRKIEACERALKIANTLDKPDLANETKVILSYARLAKYIYQVADLVSESDLHANKKQDDLKALIANLKTAGEDNANAIRSWRLAISPEPWHIRVHDAISATEKTVNDIAAIAGGKYLY